MRSDQGEGQESSKYQSHKTILCAALGHGEWMHTFQEFHTFLQAHPLRRLQLNLLRRLDSFYFIAIHFSAEESQRQRTSDGSTSPTKHKTRKKRAPELMASHPNLKISTEHKAEHVAKSVPSFYLQGFTSCCYSKPGVQPFLWSLKRYIKSESLCSN